MLSFKRIMTLMAGCSLLAACQLDPIDIPADELYTREFIKNYGIINSEQDWSVVKRGAITVTTTQTTNVQIFTKLGGVKTVILGSFADVSGTQTLEFDCPKETETVMVKTSSTFEIVPLGGDLIIGPESRGTSGTDALTGYTIDNGWYVGPEYLKAVQKILPEGDPNNLNRKNIVADFNFVSDGTEFALYPIGWQTTANDVLGVYWYKDGKMYTKDIFDNKVMEGNVKYHNIYTRATKGGPLTITPAIKDGTVNVPLSGTFKISFNRNVRTVTGHSAKFVSSSNTVDLVWPTEVNGHDVTYAYSGLEPDTEYTFTLTAGSFEAVKQYGERDDAKLEKTYTLKFRTEDKRAKWVSTTVTLDETGIAGTVAVTFDRAVSLGSGKLVFSPSEGIETGQKKLSTDQTTITVPFSGCDYSTTYTIYPASDFASHAEGIMMGSENDIKETFTTPKKLINYESSATVVGFREGLNNGSTKLADDFTSETQILEENDYLSATLTYSGQPLRADSHFPDLKFPVDNGEPASFNIAFKSKMIVETQTPSGDNYAGIYLSATSDLLLSVYGFPDKSDKVIAPTVYDLDSKTILTETDHTYDIQTVIDKNNNSVTYNVFRVKFEIKAGNYFVCIDKSTNGYLAGFAYQLPDSEASDGGETSRGYRPRSFTKYNTKLFGYDSAARSRADGSNGINLNIHKLEDWDSNRSHYLVDEGYFRTDMNKKDAVSTAGEDEVITHRVAFTLPKGTIFGFYIRNNNGAAQITGDGNNPKPYTNYSMSSLNKSMKNSFFNSLDLSKTDAKFFTEGWGTPEDGNYDSKVSSNFHDKLTHDSKLVKVSDTRRYSTASTYTDDEGNRYFSFEDWVDYDFNDIMFLLEKKDVEVVDGDVETNPYIFAVEDLGATSASDIDFNDVVFAVEHLDGSDSAFVTVLAAGGTLKTDLCYDGKVIGREIGEIVDGPLDPSTRLEHINQWFGHAGHGTVINAGTGVNHPFDELTTVRIPVDKNFSIVDAHKADLNKLGFTIRVERGDGDTWDEITRPDHLGEAPQIIILPGTWAWPLETTPIMEAYPGGINENGNFTPSFKEWVNGGDGKGYQNTKWHLTPAEGKVMEHPWEGSDAARRYFYNHMENRDN